MTTYAPRTLLRLYNPDKTAHVTGVVLKDGRIYETTGRKTYDSFDQWNTERDQGGNMTIDTSKAEGVIISDDWKGFTKSKGYTPHTDWIYCSMLEYTPHLLEREDVRNAFNNYQNVYADLVRKGEIYTGSYYIRKGESALTEPNKYRIPCGYTRTSHIRSDQIVKELMDVYTPLYELIKPDLSSPLFERSEKERKKQKEKRTKYLIGVYQRRLAKYKKLITETEKAIESLKDRM